jgi:hypothetical protein
MQTMPPEKRIVVVGGFRHVRSLTPILE